MLRERWSKAFVYAGAAALPLQNAATFDVGFTVRLSYVFFALALAVGMPFALRGLRQLPAWFSWPALALVVLYAAVTLTTHLDTIPGNPRGGLSRAFVYLLDLGLGVAVMCLVRGLWRDLEDLQPLLLAVTAGAGLASLYAIWQWPAQHYGLPFANILSTHDSNGVTTGGEQGPGLLGWERVRGTFLEPHFLGAFMSAAAPLAVVAARQARGRTRMLALAAAGAAVIALLLTSSAPAWAGAALAIVAAATMWAIGEARPVAAAAAAVAASAVLIAAPLVIAEPQVLSALTGRSAVTLTATADFRKATWARVLDVWAARPAVGFGAGQSSVRLSLVTEGRNAVGLNSAQGLWAASLIDSGLIGLGLWLALLGAAAAAVLRYAAAEPGLRAAALAAAFVAALAAVVVATDRLDLRVWLLLGIIATAAAAPRRRDVARPTTPAPR